MFEFTPGCFILLVLKIYKGIMTGCFLLSLTLMSIRSFTRKIRVTSIYLFQTRNLNSTFDILVLTSPIYSCYLPFLLRLSLLPLSQRLFLTQVFVTSDTPASRSCLDPVEVAQMQKMQRDTCSDEWWFCVVFYLWHRWSSFSTEEKKRALHWAENTQDRRDKTL